MNKAQPLSPSDDAAGRTGLPLASIESLRKRRLRRGTPSDQCVLMLQGPTSTFWSLLAEAFDAAGVRVIHVRVSFADWLFWRGPGKALSYRGRLSNWEGWLERLIDREGVTDILYFADRLPYHVAAQRIAERRVAEGRPAPRPWAFEFGYLRPNWLTLEPFAMGRRSRFTRDPDVIRRLAQDKPPASLRAEYEHPFAVEAVNEVVFNLAHDLGRIAFPLYRKDKKLPPIVEYLSWLPRLATARRARERAASEVRRHIAGPEPFVVVALQLDTDYQIRASSDYSSQREMLDEVIASFARSAPADMRLLIKEHPLDPAVFNWRRHAERLARRHGVEGRITTIRGGNLTALMQNAHGLITTNSTSGVTALSLGCPVRVMGDAVYDIEGLTHRGALDSFWTAPERPDAELFDAWARAAAATIQLRGSIRHPRGRQRAAVEIVRRVTNPGRYWRIWRDLPPEG